MDVFGVPKEEPDTRRTVSGWSQNDRIQFIGSVVCHGESTSLRREDASLDCFQLTSHRELSLDIEAATSESCIQAGDDNSGSDLRTLP